MNRLNTLNTLNTLSVPVWTITLLGSLAAVPQGLGQGQSRIISRFRTHKYGALLGYLAYHVHTVHSRESVIALLWPEMDEKAGRNNLSVALSSLRNQLEPPGTPKGAVIVADRFHVGLNAASLTTDVSGFEDALRLAEATNSAIERGQCLSRAIDLYRGPLLKGYDEEWIAGERERLAGLFFGALRQRIDNLEAEGDLSSALSHARKAVSADPLREEGQTHLIRLLAATGEPYQALRQFREFERLLLRDSGDDPSLLLWSLIRRIEAEAGLVSAQPRALRARSVALPSKSSGGRADVTGSTDDTGFGSRATLTFLLTEITEISETWRHLVREAISRHGSEAAESGGGLTAAFASAGTALSCAVLAQKTLQSFRRSEGTELPRVRMALHTGDVEVELEGAGGPANPLREQVLHRASRMLTAAQGGQVLVSEATATLVRGVHENDGEFYLIDLGTHRLQDVAGSEHLFQVNYAGMAPAEFPPPITLPVCEPNMPTTITRFFGRKHELAELTQMLRDGRQPLVTLTGTGGTGKTRLAIEAARQLVPYFGGAVFFVPLAGIADPALIPDAILSALRLPRSPQRDPLDQAAEALAKQPTLLLMDNLEHLIEGGGIKIVAELSRVSALTLVVTSRQVLDFPEGCEFALSPLPTPEGMGDTPEELSRFDSVALFLDRAQAAKPDFQITNHNSSSVRELCDRLEGIPLAIELAAARALVLTPAQMLVQLADRFAFLTSTRRSMTRGMEERLRTLRGAIDWSYQLLPPELQRFFCRLSVFRCGWTSEAAEVVCDESLALDYLAQLRDASMVLSEETDNGMRFRMLETLRQFGHELLEQASETQSIGRRHLVFFRTRAEMPEWQKEADIDNLRHALNWSRGIGGDVREGLQLAGELANFWWYAGLLREGNDYLADLLSRQDTSSPDWVRAKALAGRAWILVRLGQLRDACSLYEESLHIYRQLNDRKGAATSLNTLADTLRMVGRHEESRTLQEESLSLFQELDDQEGVSFAFRDLGDLALRLGTFTEARRCYQASDTAIGGMNAMTLLRLTEIALFEGHYDEARRRGEERVEALRVSPQRCGEAFLLVGAAAMYQGDVDGAHTAFSKGLRRFQEIGSTLFIPRALRLFAYLAIVQAEPERAARLLGASEGLCEKLETPLPPCERSEYEQHVRDIHVVLKDDAFTAAWEAGRAMSWEEAVHDAMEETTG